jgi:hypothetical protein
LRGTVNLQPDTTMAEIEALGQKGVCGMRLNWWRKKELPDIKIYRDSFPQPPFAIRCMGTFWGLAVEDSEKQ